jgi:hypothetical protein
VGGKGDAKARREAHRRSSVDLGNPELRSEFFALHCMHNRISMFARLLNLESGYIGDSIPSDYLDLFLRLLVTIRKGEYPLLPPVVQRMTVSTCVVTGAMEQVLRNLRSHERLSMISSSRMTSA